MALRAIYAHLSCSDLARSADWYAGLFQRPPDARPMTGLAEWHHGGGAGFQLFEDAPRAGQATLTLIVDGIAAEHARLASSGLATGDPERGAAITVLRLRDPDGNLVVLAEPSGG